METKNIFVIMPFTETPSRDQDDLTQFYETTLKRFIETDKDYKYHYKVSRSGDSFDINDQIIRDLYNADIVLCDLSGKRANPNVMYELGIRFGISAKPVIIFRESHPENDPIFDIHGFYTHPYKVTQYHKLQEHIKKKITDYENDLSRYESPIIKVLKRELSVEREVNRNRAYSLMLSLEVGLAGMARNVGGYISDLASDSAEIAVPKNYEDNLKYFQENIEKLRGLDWSKFNFKPYKLPPLEEYLAQLPLRALLSDDIEKKVTQYSWEYFNVFFSSNRIWQNMDVMKLIFFVGECRTYEYIADAVQALLKEPSDQDVERITGKIHELIEQSNLA